MNVALLIHDKVEHYNVISNTIIETGDNVLIFENKVTFSELISCEIDLILIYGYRHLLNKQFRDKFKNKIINLHPSYLPFGRGCYPNFWSFVDDTPKGVSLHFINEGIDTGDILFQRKHTFDKELTLKETYYNLQTSMLSLFSMNYSNIREYRFSPIKQNYDEGTFYFKKDFDLVFGMFEKGFNTKIKDIISKRDLIKKQLNRNYEYTSHFPKSNT